MTLELRFLPARQGDAIWIRWGTGRQLLIDMGTEETGLALRKKLAALPKKDKDFDLLVVTHVDSDHIGGVLTAIADAPEIPHLVFDDVWFNGWDHLNSRSVTTSPGGLQPMGPAQGERLSDWLEGQHWNRAFGGAAAVRGDLKPVALPQGLTLTVISPTQKRLARLIPEWKAVLEEALEPGASEHEGDLEPMGATAPPVLDSTGDLLALAEDRASADTSPSNGASICLLLEWKGRRVLLTGDGFGADIAEGLKELGRARPDLRDDTGRIRVDVVKLPHHGSRRNVTRGFVEALTCPYWVFSSDGTTFRHPDAVAIARVLQYSGVTRPTLAFNLPSEFNAWWKNPQWRRRFGYSVKFGSRTNGLTVTLDAD
ncbi:hypothetical protein BH10ACT7_BH10ACT7_24670 [soil metagenome]